MDTLLTIDALLAFGLPLVIGLAVGLWSLRPCRQRRRAHTTFF
jgi:hypothetical protein